MINLMYQDEVLTLDQVVQNSVITNPQFEQIG